MHRFTPRFAALALGALLLNSPSFPSAQAKSAPVKAKSQAKVQNVVISADVYGYHPSVVNVQAGRPVRLVFVSKGSGCTNSIVIPALNKKIHLRMGQKQAVSFTPKKGQSITFACSMDMFHGKAVAK